jgi:hypothetical protein
MIHGALCPANIALDDHDTAVALEGAGLNGGNAVGAAVGSLAGPAGGDVASSVHGLRDVGVS